MCPSNSDRSAMTIADLNLIQQALSINDRGLRLAVCNHRFQKMFDLPERRMTPGADFADTTRYLAERGDYGKVDGLEEFVHTRVEQGHMRPVIGVRQDYTPACVPCWPMR